MRKLAMWLGLLVLAGVVVFGAYVRLAPSDPAVWHVDPVTVTPPDSPNFALLRPAEGTTDDPVLAMPPETAMARLNAIALASPRVRLLAGSPESDFATYIARSAFWGFPDYISVKALPAPGGSQLAIFSRSRFGHSDMGVNAARVDDWLAQLQAEGG